MTSRVSHTTVNCTDAYALSEWWKPVLGYVDVDGDPNEPGHEECMILTPDGSHRLLFIEVDELQPADGRWHLDLVPTDTTRDAEVERLVAHGASVRVDRRNDDGGGWVVMTDPDGNEFCVLRSDAERSATHG
jgi:catechol 2,3-dioxygenase-like lactoylglutathione lyase family enzyme